MSSEKGSRVVSGFTVYELIGAAFAAYCSWTINGSVGWAFIHALFGWFYILYICAGFGGGFPYSIF